VKQKVPSRDELSQLELMRIVPLSEASRLSGIGRWTLKRSYADKLIRLSERRYGMRLRDALMIGQGEADSAP
jgi:hypothetical protein